MHNNPLYATLTHIDTHTQADTYTRKAVYHDGVYFGCKCITLLKVVSHYDLSLSMSVMELDLKKSLYSGLVGGVSSIQFFFRIF